MCFMRKPFGTVFLSVCTDKVGTFVEARDDTFVCKFDLPQWFKCGASPIKVSSEFIIVASSSGHLLLLKFERDDHNDSNSGRFVKGNTNGSLLQIYNHCTLPILNQEALTDISTEEILLKTSTFDDSPVFDIVGTWLVYAPTRSEISYFKKLQVSADSSANGRLDKKAVAKSMYTPVKLPLGNPLLLSLMASLSNSAFDKLFKLTQYGTKKFRGYMSSSNKIIDKDVSLHSISTSIGKTLYSTALKLKKQAVSSGSNEYIKIIDLVNGQIMATFKPPKGISHLSLSPYDLHLIQASYRGDSFYMWDLYKAPKEVSLIEKFTRGKTSAKTKEIFWFVNVNNTEVLPGTNSGFGCITKESGSVHWYNINYLFCGNETSNYPTIANNSLAQVSPSSGQFLDSWVLPSNRAEKFFKLPRLSNMNTSASHGDSTTTSKTYLSSICQLSFLDSDGCIRLLSPLNGKHTFKYVLPKVGQVWGESRNSTNEGTNPHYTHTHYQLSPESLSPIPHYRSEGAKATRKFDIPLSQSEIETVAPYLSFINNKKVELCHYNFEGDDEGDAFFGIFDTFGEDVPVVEQRVAKDSGTNTPMNASGEIVLDGGLEIHVAHEYEE